MLILFTFKGCHKKANKLIDLTLIQNYMTLTKLDYTCLMEKRMSKESHCMTV